MVKHMVSWSYVLAGESVCECLLGECLIICDGWMRLGLGGDRRLYGLC